MLRNAVIPSLVFVGLSATFTAATPADIHAIAQAVDAHYDHLHTLQADFTETYRGPGTQRLESGTLLLKKPGKMRWEYRSPKDKLFLSDGKTAWFYVPEDRQVRKTDVRKLDDLRSPLAFLLGKTRLEKEFGELSLAQDITPQTAGDIVIRGVPKAMADRVNQVLFEIAPSSQIARIVIEQADGSTVEYKLTDQKENAAIPDETFHFAPPAGTEVVDGEFGQ